MDIIFSLMKSCCENHKECKNCPLFNEEKGVSGDCVISKYPACWNLNDIGEATAKLLEESKFLDMFYNGIANKLLEVMNVKGDDCK